MELAGRDEVTVRRSTGRSAPSTELSMAAARPMGMGLRVEGSESVAGGPVVDEPITGMRGEPPIW